MRLMQIRCQCSEIVLKALDQESKIRSKIIVIRDGEVFAVCKGCNSEVSLPLQVNEKSNPPLFIKNYKKSD